MNYEAITRTSTLLKIEDVSQSYGDKLILRNVNAEIRDVVRPGLSQGQVVGLLGPSGRGKTQLFRILAGLQNPTTGRVLAGAKLEPVKLGEVGVVDQHYTLFDHRTVGTNLVIAGGMAGLKPKDAEEKARTFLKRFQLEEKWGEYPQRLSGGQRQRVAIIQQLMCSRGFLLMDEPFSGLDPNMQRQACELIMEVAALDELFTIVVVTHDITAAMKISDTLWILGFDRREDGTAVPGARIQQEIDLVSAGLAWDPNMESRSDFQHLRNDIISRFRSL